MSQNQNNQLDSLLQYMSLDNKDFIKAKQQKEYLQIYSKLSSINLNADIGSANNEKGDKDKLRKEQEAKVIAQKEADLKREQEKKEENQREILRLAEQKRIAELEIQERKEAKAKEANEKGLNLDGFKIKQHDAWSNLCKMVKMYVCALHKINDYDKLVESLPNGVLPEKDHDAVVNIVKAISDVASKKEKEKWNAPFESNFYLKKLAQWIGKAKAQQFG
jgi:hypothetical protein